MVNLLLRNPRIAIGIVTLLVGGGFFAHYKYMGYKIDKLQVEKAAFEQALAQAATNMARLTEDARIAAEATIQMTAERNAAQHALDDLRRGRETDPESMAWGAELIPLGELERLCLAIPNMEGCP